MRIWFACTMTIGLMGMCATGLHAQTARLAYTLSAAIHRGPAGCGDAHSSSELYVVISRLDPVLQRRVDAVERKSRQVVGGRSMSRVRSKLRDLAERVSNSSANPLSAAEQRILTRLRDAKRVYREAVKRARRAREPVLDHARLRALVEALDAELKALGKAHRAEQTYRNIRRFPYDDELKALESRETLSVAESQTLRQGRELLNEWRRLRSQLLVRTSPRRPASLRVYPDDQLHVVIWEDDIFQDDRCFSTVVTLDSAALDDEFLDIEETSVEAGRAVQRVLVTLRLAPVR